jgi:hypothetical protein
MIRYALICDHEHAFEAWFAGSDAYDSQAAAGLVECPVCGSAKVAKQIMAPAVSSKTRETGGQDFHALAAKVRRHIRDTHVYVGDKFAEEARSMHTGEKPEGPIYGEATPAEAAALKDEGVPAAPLHPLLTPTPPKKVN